MNISQKKLEKSRGRLEIKIKDQNLQKLYQQGSSKALMPDFHENLKQLMLINTAGGITSGDEYDFKFEIDSSNLCISTQAAEKIYSGFGNPANLEINVNLLNNSNLFWLPKELILFNNCNLKRKINFNLSKDSNLLLCENIIFGRTSMKEKFEKGFFSDFWTLRTKTEAECLPYRVRASKFSRRCPNQSRRPQYRCHRCFANLPISEPVPIQLCWFGLCLA